MEKISIMKGVIHTEVVKNHVGVTTIDHPPINDLPGYLLTELADKIRQMGKRNEIKVILLKSGGNRVFCAGASFEEMLALKGQQEAEKFFMGFAHVIRSEERRVGKGCGCWSLEWWWD